MLNKEQIKNLVAYWQKIAKHDWETMQVLYKTKRYSDSLFFGHIVLEKILKAHVVISTKQHAPYTHNLVKLAELAELNISKDEMKFLSAVNKFNIRCRYPEYKIDIYKLCNKTYTDSYLNKTLTIYEKLCKNLKQKK
jgi:HEPN domain-containing protein